jgi:hypothetical protein
VRRHRATLEQPCRRSRPSPSAPPLPPLPPQVSPGKAHAAWRRGEGGYRWSRPKVRWTRPFLAPMAAIVRGDNGRRRIGGRRANSGSDSAGLALVLRAPAFASLLCMDRNNSLHLCPHRFGITAAASGMAAATSFCSSRHGQRDVLDFGLTFCRIIVQAVALVVFA